jgi:isoaspartyl peptidase/L-asparaginase-like protein (Ntn-hydrolase superfamily)
MEAVEKVINYLENNILFNAGKGAVFTSEGKHELDASIMQGKDLSAVQLQELQYKKSNFTGTISYGKN